jgi:hypothetical protein
VGLKLNGTHQLLSYADDVNLLGDNIDTINENTETLTDASKEVGLEVNVEKTKICWCHVTRMQAKIGRKLYNERLSDLYSLPSVIRIIKSTKRWMAHVVLMREKRNMYRLLVGKPEGRRPLGRPRCGWIDNIKKDLLEIGLSAVDWIGLTQDRYRWRVHVNMVINLRVP